MNPEYIDEEEEAEAQSMAAMMGFSAFGSHKPPAKKRKFNAGTDAYVDGQELAKLDKGGKKGQGSGGNTMPLGKIRVIGGGIGKAPTETLGNERSTQERATTVAATSKDGETDPSDDLDGPIYIDTSKTPPAEVFHGDESVDSSQPPPISYGEAQEVQARIDALLSSIETGATADNVGPETNLEDLQRSHMIPQTFGDTVLMLGGPRPHANRRDNFDDSASAVSISRPNRRGEKNPTWYIGYYDPSFNENPWEKLENEKGLKPLCKWPENIGRRPLAG